LEIVSSIYGVVLDNPGIRAGKIAALLNVQRSQVTRVLPIMQRRGYLLSEYKNRLFAFRNLNEPKRKNEMKLTNDTVTKTVSVLGAFINTATVKGKRNPTDFWADRLRTAAAQRSLIETLNE
jgi:predicted transcriptional regulator